MTPKGAVTARQYGQLS